MFLLVAACTPERGQVWLGYPDITDARSMIVAHREADIELEAVDLDAGPYAAEFRLGEAPPYRSVYALLYDEPLARFGYVEGSMVRATTAADGDVLVPPDRSFVTEVDETSLGVTWRTEGTLPDDIRDFRVLAQAKCATFGAAREQYVLDGGVHYILPLDETHALVRSFRDTFVLSHDERRDLTNALLQRTTAGFIAPDGMIYVADSTGEIWRGTPSVENGIENPEMVVDTGLFNVRAMAGGLDDDKIDLILVNNSGVVGHVNEATYVEVGTVGEFRTSMVWRAPGEAFIPAIGIDTVYAVGGGRVVETEIDAESEVMHLSPHEYYGVVAGTAEGHFFALDNVGTSWSRISGGDFGWWALASTSYEDGFMFLLASGFLGQYKRSRGYCESSPILPIIEAARMTTVGIDVVIAAVPDDAPMTVVAYIPR